MNDFLQKANSFPMYAVAFVVIAVVMLMAAFFLFKAYREGLKIGMEKKKLHKVLTSSVVFSIVPSIGILMGVITLAGSLGIPLPWLRLSVIGSFSYETIAANIFPDNVTDATIYVTVALVMTCGMLVSMFLPLITGKKIQRGLMRMRQRDKKWGEIFMTDRKSVV